MTVMELMHRLNLKHLFVFELPRSRIVSAFFQRDSCPTEVSWTSTIRLVCPELSDDKQKRHRKKAREKETAQKREGKERDSFAVFPSKALPHCSRFLAHFA